MRITTVNPETGEVLETYETMSREEILEIVRPSHERFLSWREGTLAERAPCVRRLAAVLRERRDEFAAHATLEMGKPITEARAEVEKCAWLCDVYAENGERWLAEEAVEADGRKHAVVFQPLGLILSIMPWNFPYWQAIRFAIPTVLAGNTFVLKHASNVPRCAHAIEEMFAAAEFPADVMRTIFADHKTVTDLMALDLVRGVSLTGSTEAGARIAAAAGENLKKTVLELGGSDPFVVLEDVDVAFAAANAVVGRTINVGQSCIAAKRFIVVEAVAEAFAQQFAERMAELVIGDPMDPDTQIGPVVNEEALSELRDQLDRSVRAGAKVLTGGTVLDRPGFYFTPTVLGLSLIHISEPTRPTT